MPQERTVSCTLPKVQCLAFHSLSCQIQSKFLYKLQLTYLTSQLSFTEILYFFVVYTVIHTFNALDTDSMASINKTYSFALILLSYSIKFCRKFLINQPNTPIELHRNISIFVADMVVHPIRALNPESMA